MTCSSYEHSQHETQYMKFQLYALPQILTLQKGLPQINFKYCVSNSFEMIKIEDSF